ncbi:PLP-dependent aminotransferase family protein [Salinivibrio sp. ES.052]|uniref:aminotransferase-like domain-containing protein n=1 Tax=Salinivibrio sp. ES.052 TaxID=1882823 RepID=UPI000929F441|nr:PLP-dependent aminotransferase family protein [Salinivibrio sp. ES.052]SIO42022.1 transcriptional regulator, GntR family [Salinivibrio sp. ES.052]
MQVRYQDIASWIEAQIQQRVWQVGDRIPSVREMSRLQHVSPMTVMRAYEQLEADGWVEARPRSGFFVRPHYNQVMVDSLARPQADSQWLNTHQDVFDVISASHKGARYPFGSAFPDPQLFPMQALGRAMARVLRQSSHPDHFTILPPGDMGLRRLIAQRYLRQGIRVSIDEIIITNGAIEALSLSLAALTQPGDKVIIEAPAFYGVLQTLERLQLEPITVSVDSETGVDINELESALASHHVTACWLMSNFHNPTGASIPDADRPRVVSLLAAYQVPLIEDDVYGELFFSSSRPMPLKAYDTQGGVLHCGSFSKQLAPGFRVGWIAAGCYAMQIEKRQYVSSLAVGAPNQLAIADYLKQGGYDAHLRRLRKTLFVRLRAIRAELKSILPSSTMISEPKGGYFLWVTLDSQIDTRKLFQALQPFGVTIAPGALFATDDRFNHCFRLNVSIDGRERIETASHNEALDGLTQIATSLSALSTHPTVTAEY